MKKITAMLLALCVALTLAACGPKTETIYVQTQSVRTIYNQTIRTDYTYSDSGELLTTTLYFNDELYYQISRRTSNGVVYVTTTDAEGNESVQTSITTYDENGNVLCVEQGYSGNTTALTNYTYDENGNLLTAVTETSDSVTDTVYTYNENGSVISKETTTTYEDATTVTRMEYTYDENGYVVQEKEFDGDGVCLGYIVYTYVDDNTGRTITYYNGDGTATGEVEISTYDGNGLLVETRTTLDGELAQTITYTYEALEIPVTE